jgi:Acetyltransferase (GNAT) family./Uncharacterised protein family (UPF0158).
MRVELRDVIDAIEEVQDDEHAFYDPASQTVVYEGDAEDLIVLPGREERGDYRNMENFIETVENEEAQEWLSNAIVGKGAFRRFRAACEKFHLLEDWYDYEEKAHKALAVQWCEDNGIVWEDHGREVEIDEDDVSDFLHEDSYAEEEIIEDVTAETVAYRLVTITERNLMNALYITDYYLQMMYHGASDLEYAKDQLNTWLQEGCVVYAVSDHGRFVGLGVGKNDLEDFVIKAVYVNEDHRRKGIGSMLIHAFEQQDIEYASYRLEMNPKLTGAVAFFEKTGYQVLPSITLRKVPQD